MIETNPLEKLGFRGYKIGNKLYMQRNHSDGTKINVEIDLDNQTYTLQGALTDENTITRITGAVIRIFREYEREENDSK